VVECGNPKDIFVVIFEELANTRKIEYSCPAQFVIIDTDLILKEVDQLLRVGTEKLLSFFGELEESHATYLQQPQYQTLHITVQSPLEVLNEIIYHLGFSETLQNLSCTFESFHRDKHFFVVQQLYQVHQVLFV